MESLRINVKCSKEEMSKVFEKDPIVIVKMYEPNGNGDGYICNIRYPECMHPIKDCSEFESWEELRDSIMNKHVRYINKTNKRNAENKSYTPVDARAWFLKKKKEISERFS